MGADLAAVAGGASKVLALVALYPVNVVKTRLQEQRGQGEYRGLRQALRLIIEREGVRGLYKGLGPAMWRLSINSALFFGLYETAKLPLLRIQALREE